MTADRPATEPRTERIIEIVEEYNEDRAINGEEEAIANLARALARAEAAQGAAPSCPCDEYEPCTEHQSEGAAPRAEGLDVDWGAMRRAGWEPDFNVCASCHHHGSRHDLNNVCLDCGDRFSSMSEDEQWAWAAAEYARLSRPSDERVPERQQLVEQIKAGLPGFCVCDIAYTERQMEAPNCPTHDIERWLSEGFDVRHYPNDNCGNPAHDRILDAWYARAKALVASRRVPESEER